MRRPPPAGALPGGVAVKGHGGDPQGPQERGLCRLLRHGRGQGHADGPPGTLPRRIVDHLDLERHPLCQQVEIAGPGFLNFRLGHRVVRPRCSQPLRPRAPSTAQSQEGQGQAGHGGVRLRQPHRPHAHGQRPGRRAGGHPGHRPGACGADVTPGRSSTSTTPATRSTSSPCSIEARYLQLILGEDERRPSPRTATTGDDIKDLARAFYEQHGDSWRTCPRRSGWTTLAQFGLARQHPQDEGGPGAGTSIDYDKWFFESTLHESGYVAETVELLTEQGLDL